MLFTSRSLIGVSFGLCLFHVVSGGEVKTARPFFLEASDLVDASPECAAALNSTIDCPPQLLFATETFFPDVDILNAVCTPECKTSVDNYHRNIAAACADSWTWTQLPETGSEEQPITRNATYFGDWATYNRDMYCERQDDGKFCLSLFREPLHLNETSIAAEKTRRCGECGVRRMRTQINSPIGFDESTRDAYEALVNECGLDPKVDIVPPKRKQVTITPEERVKGVPGYFAELQPAEDCESFSIRTNASTTQILRVNKLQIGCGNWPTGGKLFVPKDAECNAYVVKDDDDCMDITRRWNIRLSEFLSWNPEINSKCTNLLAHKQTTVCVSQPGGEYMIPDSVLHPPPRESKRAIAPRGAIADRTNTHCQKYHQHDSSHTCTAILMRYRLTFDDFAYLNPSVDSDCGNLSEGAHYCVEPVGSFETYDGHPAAIKLARRQYRIFSDTGERL